MNKLTTFYLVRHGETEYNVKKIIQGQSDSPLTKKGIEEVKNVAKKLKGIKFDYVFSSDLLRAKRTAEIIALEHKLEIQTNKLLRERRFGNLEGKSNSELKWEKRFDNLTNEQKYTYKHSPDIESDEEIVTRFLTFIREVAIGYPRKTILVVTHGGIIRTSLVKFGFGNYENLRPGAVKNGAFVKLKTDGTDFFVKEVSGVQFTS